MAWLLGWKIDMQSHAGFQFHGTLSDIVTSHPSFQHVATGREMFQTVSAGGVGFRKVRRLQDENGPAHSLVNLAVNGDRSRLVENDRGRFLVLPVTA